MRFRSRTLTFIASIFVLLAISAGIFWQPLFTQMAQWSLRGYCKYCLQTSVSAEKVTFQDGKLIFQEIVFQRKPKNGVSVEGRFPEARIGLDFTGEDTYANFLVSLQNPTIHVTESKRKDKQALDPFARMPKSNYLGLHLQVADGALSFKNSRDVVKTLQFSGQGYKERGQVCFYFENLGSLACSYDSSDWNLIFHESSLADALHAAHVLGIESFLGSIHQGRVNGELAIEWNDDDPPAVEGDLLFADCVFESPCGNIHGYIPEGSLILEEDSFAGEFSLSKGAYLEYSQEGKSSVSLSQLQGKLSLPAYDRCFINALGKCTHHGTTFDLAIDGHLKVPGQAKASCDLEIILSSPEQEPIKICASSVREGCGAGQCTLNVHNFGAGEWDLLMLALGTQDIGLDPYTLKSGAIDALFIVDLESSKCKRIQIKEFVAKHIAFDLDQSEISMKIDHAEGNISLDLSVPNVLDSLEASFAIDGGEIHFPALHNKLWELSSLSTNLAVEKGVLKKSFVRANFMGLGGLIEVDLAADKVMNLQFDGKAAELASFASTNLQRGIHKKFKHDQLSIVADVWKNRTGLTVESAVSVFTDELQESGAINIGFMLEKNPGNRPSFYSSSSSFCQKLGGEVLDALAKEWLLPVDEPASEWIKKELRIAGYTLKNGWFSAQNLPTEKFIGPFFFQENEIDVKGSANFKGRFDCDSMAVEYEGKDIVFENEDFLFEIHDMGNGKHAKHHFDFLNDINKGEIPLRRATYFEKNSGLLFLDLEGHLTAREEGLSLSSLKTRCNHVFFEGGIAIDYSPPEKKAFTADVQIDNITGKFSHVRELLSHFPQTAAVTEWPLEGELCLQENGGAFTFAFRKNDCKVSGILHGAVRNGSLEMPNDLLCHGVDFSFDYDLTKNQLDVKKISCTLCPAETKEPAYRLQNGYIGLFDVGNVLGSFDLSFVCGQQELLRLAGTTELASEPKHKGQWQISLNQKISHLGNVHPKLFEMVVSKDREIALFGMEWECDLDLWYEKVKNFGALALSAYAPDIAKRLKKASDLSGNVSLNLEYDNATHTLNAFMKGRRLAMGEFACKNFLLSCVKKGHLWSIDQLQIDKFSAAADLLPQENGCRVNFLGLRYGGMLLMGLEGFYDYSSTALEGRVNLLEIDFSQLGEWKSFKELVKDYRPAGEMKGTGSIALILKDQGLPELKFDLKTSLKNCSLRGLHFENTQNTSFKYSWRDSLVIQGCHSGLRCMDTDSTQGVFGVDTAIYDFKKEELTLRGLHFHTGAASLDWIANRFQSVFPEVVTPRLASIIRNIKADEAFKGSLDLKLSDDVSKLSLQLPQGKYKLASKEHEINNFVLEWDKKSLQIVTQYKHQNTQYWALVRSISPDIDAGDLYISLSPPQEDKLLASQVCVGWYMHPQYGLVVEKAHGRLPGVFVDLARDRHYPMNPYTWHLDGRIILDPSKGYHVLPPDIVEALASWNIQGDFVLAGKWIFVVEAPHDGELCFQGQLEGREIALKGYRLKNIRTQLDCSPCQIDFENFIINDLSGDLRIPSGSLVKSETDDWWVQIPYIAGESFRPSLLRAIENPAVVPKPLVISQFIIQDVICRADDLSTMQGVGSLHFNNSSKKSMHNPLLAIPAEIISRIGLNLNVLNPVSGIIDFEIEDYKVKLKKFKDVYSERKLSKFYLPRSSQISYVDFEGNIHVQVRMKQYNLLFKLAELFTVGVQGNLLKPVYTLQKQH